MIEEQNPIEQTENVDQPEMVETPVAAPVAEPAAEVATERAEPQSEAATHSLADIFAKRRNDDDDDINWDDESGYSSSERQALFNLYDSTLRQFNENEIVIGKIVRMDDRNVIVNIGFKSEGIISRSEFRDNEKLKPGDSVEVFIETVEDLDGQLQLSRKRAKSMRAWERINESLESDTILLGSVERRTKGGFVVDIEGIEAFLPGSQIDVKPVRDFDLYVGKQMEFKVVKINHAYENVVVSHKVLIEEKLEEQRQEILKNLDKGQVLEGTVKNMTNFGVFIDLGGVDGLLHITDISWGRINHPEEVLQLDQKVEVVVLDFDEDKKRISLGMKQLSPHPWESLPENITEGSRIKGRVVTVAEYGIFVEVVPGVEGLIHSSEMTWSQHSRNPMETYKPGDEVDALVLNIDRDERKMSLGLKQLSEDPWSKVVEKFPVDSRHTGRVRNMTNYGLFVELEEGIDGLVHISDLSWTKKFNHPSEYVKVGDPLEVVVLSIDKENRRLSLGHKQLTEDTWETFSALFEVGTVHRGLLKKIDSKGARVEVDFGIEGSVPPRHLKTAEGQPELKVDDTADFVVIEFNKEAKKLVLSHTKTWENEYAAADQARKEAGKGGKGGAKSVQSIIKPLKQGTTSLGDIEELARLKEQMMAAEETPAEASSTEDAAAAEAPVAAATPVVEAQAETETATEETPEAAE